MRRLLKDTESRQRDMVEGVKVYPKTGDRRTSVFLSPDQARPFFHVNAESDKLDTAKELAEEYESKLLEWIERE